MTTEDLSALLSLIPRPIPWEQFKGEFLPAWTKPLVSQGTAARVRLVLRELEALDPPPATTFDLDYDLVRRYIESRPPGESPWTLKSRLTTIQTCVLWCLKRRYLAINPFDVRPVHKLVSATPPQDDRHHSREEIRRVLDLMRGDIERKRGWAQWRARRLYALTATVAYCGLRAREAQRLHVIDLALASRAINLVHRPRRLKTPKSAQPVPVPTALVPILEDWLLHRLDAPAGFPFDPACPWLFPGTRRAGPWTTGKPHARPVARLTAVARRAGVEGVTFQSLRRSWATHAEYWGIPEAAIQRVLRHTSGKTTVEWYRRPDVINLTDLVRDIDF